MLGVLFMAIAGGVYVVGDMLGYRSGLVTDVKGYGAADAGTVRNIAAVIIPSLLLILGKIWPAAKPWLDRLTGDNLALVFTKEGLLSIIPKIAQLFTNDPEVQAKLKELFNLIADRVLPGPKSMNPVREASWSTRVDVGPRPATHQEEVTWRSQLRDAADRGFPPAQAVAVDPKKFNEGGIQQTPIQ